MKRRKAPGMPLKSVNAARRNGEMNGLGGKRRDDEI
jgi:hypothetical protein